MSGIVSQNALSGIRSRNALSKDRIVWKKSLLVSRLSLLFDGVPALIFDLVLSSVILLDERRKSVPMPGIEPGPPRWKRGILATRPHGMLSLSILTSYCLCLIVYCGARHHLIVSLIFLANTLMRIEIATTVGSLISARSRDWICTKSTAVMW